HRAWEHNDARRLGDHQIRDVLRRRLLYALRDVAEGGDGVADFGLALLTGCRGDDLGELHGRRHHDEIDRRALTRRHGHWLDLLLVADAERADGDLAGRHSGQIEPSVGG